ncbi:MAG: fructose-bisphosphate aldolase class I [Flavobacteriales bacterium]|nr:fructose-bisphosphate aldolase class I [Flavobacteriales bacterium]|tara:strand:+ start:9297 stop:10289 length:993 start_codon:yes stop_codon:yes gene_type:complete
MKNLKNIAQAMVSPGKGILAADESTPTCTKRFTALKIESTESSRNRYRSMLLSANNLNQYISGVILFDETFYQNMIDTSQTIPQYLKSKNILTGIKVDTGAKSLAKHPGEKITEGLDNLRERLQKYHMEGADFAKWRAVITINKNIPSDTCMHANAHALARYASLCQENSIVPIVEPEVLMEGNHNINTCYEVTDKILKIVFQELKLLKVDLEAMVLKPNMVLSGLENNEKISEDTVAKMTYDVLNKNVPKEVPGIAFLSGGQSSDLATQRLNNLNKLYGNEKSWNLTFSYGRGLQQDALLNWATGNTKKAQEALIYRAKMNQHASLGKL